MRHYVCITITYKIMLLYLNISISFLQNCKKLWPALHQRLEYDIILISNHDAIWDLMYLLRTLQCPKNIFLEWHLYVLLFACWLLKKVLGSHREYYINYNMMIINRVGQIIWIYYHDDYTNARQHRNIKTFCL